MEAASGEKKTWRRKIKKFIGAKGLLESIEQAECQLGIVLHDLQLDQTESFMEQLVNDFRTMKETFESFGSTQSSLDSSKTNQQEMDEALQAVLDETLEIVVDSSTSHNAADGNTRKAIL